MNIFPSLESMPVVDSAPIGVKFTTIEYTLDSFLKNLNDPNYSDHRIHVTIESDYLQYLNQDYIFDPNTEKAFRGIWKNERFLRGFLHVLRKRQLKMSMLEIICFNKIAYDYITSKKATDNIMNLFRDIGSYMNRDIIIPFQSVLPANVANMISIVARGSFDPEDRVGQLNEFIINYNEEELCVDTIIYIYSKLYLQDFSTLFLYSTTGRIIDYHDTKKKNWDNICSALFTILDSMTSVEIKKVLTRYGSYMELNGDTLISVSLKQATKAPQYQRIAQILSDVEINYGYTFY